MTSRNLFSNIRTRFAPSPTGFIHLGNIRSALYPWAFARNKGGAFIVRIEDTDTERSTDAAIQTILDSMAWLSLDFDEGPFFQSQRLHRYSEVIADLLDAGLAYRCYMTADELEDLRARQRAQGLTPCYDGRWRPEPGKELPAPPAGVEPVIRFKNPQSGYVSWRDAVKGPIEFSNRMLDDLIIARSDGTPTYNFCVVVDDMDMRITHVIRGDDHINNTPRQINILRALGQAPPVYAHLPTVLDASGAKMSKRTGAMSIMQYRDEGYLPEAVLNYLARLGWSHGDAEIFSRAQFIAWFDLEHLGQSPAQYDPDKLRWLNHHYIQSADNARLAELVQPFLHALGIASSRLAEGPPLTRVVALLKERAYTLKDLAAEAALFYRTPQIDRAECAQYLTPEVIAALTELVTALQNTEWTRSAIHRAFTATLKRHHLKMPQLAMPVRLLMTGTTRTPSIDAVLELFGRETMLARIRANLF